MRWVVAITLVGCGSHPAATDGAGPDGAGSPSGLDALVAACEAIDACQIDQGGLVKTENANNCLKRFAQGHAPIRPAFVQCMAAAHGNCAAARACVGQIVQTGATCTSGDACQGTQLSSCQFGTMVTT